MMVTTILDDFRKKWISGQKTAFLPEILHFFYATPMKPPFFRLRRTRLNGIISPPYHEAILDTFGFPVGGRLAAQQAVFWARLPKMGLFGPKSVVFGPKIHFFWASSNFFAFMMTGHQKNNVFMFIIMPGKLPGGARTCFWPKIGLKIRFFNATPT